MQTRTGLFEDRRRSFGQRVRVPLQAQTSRHGFGCDADDIRFASGRPADETQNTRVVKHFHHRHHYGGVNHYTNIPVCQINQSSILFYLFYLFILDLRERNSLIGFLLMIFV